MAYVAPIKPCAEEETLIWCLLAWSISPAKKIKNNKGQPLKRVSELRLHQDVISKNQNPSPLFASVVQWTLLAVILHYAPALGS